VLHIHRSERTDALVDALGALLRQPPSDPFTPDVVAVPTRGMERWISHRLSHRLGVGASSDGVCAHVLFPSPSRMLARAVAEAAVGTVTGGSDPWLEPQLTWAVLRVIEANREHPGLAPVMRYLGEAPVGGERLFPVASRLAGLFAGYAADRPAMLRDWVQGQATDGQGEALDDDLRWQPILYRLVREHLGQPGPAEQLDAICDAVVERPELVDLPERVSVLGPTRLSAAELQVLAALSREREVHLWFPHPSPRVWARGIEVGDLDSDTPLRRSRFDLATQVRSPLLAGLGRDSLELGVRLRRLGVPMTDQHHPVPERASSLLGALQQGLADDVSPDACDLDTQARDAQAPDTSARDSLAPRPDQDRSVQVHACHGPARQVEVLREVVVGLLADDDTLEPRDIVVMVPRVEEYAPMITATFGLADFTGTPTGPERTGSGEEARRGTPRHPGQRIRVRVADRSLRQTNPFLATVADLLDLADGRLRAGEVLDLAATPAVRRRFGLSDDDLERLHPWVRESGIRWGRDAEHRADAGLPDVRANTWRSGLDRLLLGVAMSEDGLPQVGGVLPLDDVSSQDIDLAGRLAELVHRLDIVLGSLRGEQPLESWVQVLLAALDDMTDAAPAEEWQLAVARRELAEALGEAEAMGATEPLALGDVRGVLAHRLAGRPTRANFRTGDLTVCSLAPMRSVPHRVVCILGLDDGAFPRADRVDGDDILARTPLVGERDVRSEDRQILLDAVHAATERLVLVYSGSDVRTNAIRPPCVPLGELLDTMLDIGGGGRVVGDREATREHLVTRHPLQPFDPRNFVPSGATGSRPFSFDSDALAGAERATSPRHPPPLLGALRLAPLPDSADLALTDLAGFLEKPAQTFLRRRLDVAVGVDELEEVQDRLPVTLDGLSAWAVADRMLGAQLDGEPEARACDAERARGTLPAGVLGEEILQTQAQRAAVVLGELEARSLPPPRSIDVDVNVGDRALVGTVPGVRGDAVTRVVVSTLSAKHRIRSWVHLLALSAGRPEPSWRSVVIGTKRRGGRYVADTFEVGPIDGDRAGVILARLAAVYDRGMCQALPLAPRTSEEFARSRLAQARYETAIAAAARLWGSTDRRSGENADEAHRYVWGTEAPLSSLLQVQVDRLDLQGDPNAFAALARHVWLDLLRTAASS
jgi:exodeoxyribonuclease V gamma subunit